MREERDKDGAGGGGRGGSTEVTRQPCRWYSRNLAWPVDSSVAYLAEVANIIESGKAVLGADRR